MELCGCQRAKYINISCVAYVVPRVHNNRAPALLLRINSLQHYAITKCTTDANRPEKKHQVLKPSYSYNMRLHTDYRTINYNNFLKHFLNTQLASWVAMYLRNCIANNSVFFHSKLQLCPIPVTGYMQLVTRCELLNVHKLASHAYR